MTTSERTWKLLPHFFLRSTGFPFDWIERLACCKTASVLDALLDCEETLTALGAEVQAALRASNDTNSLKLRQHCWERVGRSNPVSLDEQARSALDAPLGQLLERWDALVARRAELEAHARTTFVGELPARRQALRDIVSDQSFQEAIWLNSPQMLSHGVQPYLARWDSERRPSETRRIERQLISYLQRFCAKNDTASFFGPLNYGDFLAPAQADLTAPGARHIQRREAFIAYWGVASLAAAITNDVQMRPYLRPRHTSFCRIDSTDTSAVTVGDIAFRLPARAAQIVEFIDGQRTMMQIANCAALAIEQVWQDLEQLARAHVIVIGVEIPVTEIRPLAWLLNWVADLPEDCPARSYWYELLSECARIQERFAAAEFLERQELLAQLETLITQVTGEPPRRGGGQFYTDRLLIYEECLGGLTPVAFGPACAEELLAQLAPVLDLYAAHACAVHQALQTFGAALLTELAPDGRMPLLSAITRLRQHQAPEDPTSPWQQAALDQLQRHCHEQSIQLDPALLPPIDRSALQANVLLSSPDIMLIAHDPAALAAGDFQVVIGECHDTLMIWGWALCFHPQRQAVEAAAADLLREASGPRQLANLLASKRVKIVPFEFPGSTIEMLAASQKAPADRIPITEVETAVDHGCPTLRTPDRPSIMIHNGELPTLAHDLFAPPRVVQPPLRLSGHTSRILLGKAIIQREQWRIERAALLPRRYRGVSFELMYDYRRAARRLRLPRYVYVRVAGERKPVLIDRDNYFLLELLDYLLAEGAEALISEMLPTPDQLWLRDGAEAFCGELRLSFGYVPEERHDHERV